MKTYSMLELRPLEVALESNILASSGDEVSKTSSTTIEKQGGYLEDEITFGGWDQN